MPLAKTWMKEENIKDSGFGYNCDKYWATAGPRSGNTHSRWKNLEMETLEA